MQILILHKQERNMNMQLINLALLKKKYMLAVFKCIKIENTTLISS